MEVDGYLHHPRFYQRRCTITYPISKNCSFLGDLKLMVRTVLKKVFSKGIWYEK